jgi:hypothetical protein
MVAAFAYIRNMGLFDKIFGSKTRNKNHYSSVDYNQYFSSNRVGDKPVQLLSMGKLHLPSGQIVGFDPLGADILLPFNKSVAPGQYAVTACVVEMKDFGALFAAVKIEFSSVKAQSWEMAVTTEQELALLEEDEFLGVDVDGDGGLACLGDQQSKAAYDAWGEAVESKGSDKDIYVDFIEPAMRQTTQAATIGDWLNYQVPGTTNHNLVMFSAGYGEGSYPCYWGIAADGSVCSLVMDLQVLNIQTEK